MDIWKDLNYMWVVHRLKFIPNDDADDTVEGTGPTRTLLTVEDEDELVKSEDEFKFDVSCGKLSSKSLNAPHST